MDPNMIPSNRLPGLTNHPRVTLGHHPTPIDHLPRLGEELGIDLWAKRDDCNGLAFGGNKVRQLEYYLGPAAEAGADTMLITGALQSNFVRLAVASANKLGMRSEVQLEERVPDTSPLYRSSGNVMLDQLLGATIHHFPEGENEAAADAALDQHADRLRQEGRKPHVIHLGAEHPPIGGLGYAAAAAECLDQLEASGEVPDVVVIPSGSAITHCGFLAGARAIGWNVPIIGICVRRNADVQEGRVLRRAREVLGLLGSDAQVLDEDVIVRDEVLAPGYGRIGRATREALTLMARSEGIFLDPVYSAKTFAGLLGLLEQGAIEKGQKVVLLHTGGQPALFGYQDELQPS